MAKIHLDRLSKRGYAPGTVKNGKYRALVRKIMAENTKMIHNRVGDITKKEWAGVSKKLPAKVKPLAIPSLDEVLPAKSIQSLKSAHQGNLITDTLRDAITAKLRASVLDYTGKPTKKITPDLVKAFEKDIRKVFRGYTKKDPAIGIPANIHTIAVTETRTAINNIKNQFADKLQRKNSDIVVQKRWVHNNSLSAEPRPGHLAMNGKTIPITEKFVVKTFRKYKGRWTPTGRISMAHPHDTSAPPGETIGCNCDVVYITVRAK
jgi:hypothetical protein